MQTLKAFSHIQDALSFIINSYTMIAEWQAVMRRLLTFLNHVQSVEQETKAHNNFVYTVAPDNTIQAKNVSILTPTGDHLLTNINLVFEHGQHYWIKGPSGIGKSTFVRALAGIWPYGRGEIALPSNQHVMFVPQRSYMPLGTLREALLFPTKSVPVSDAVLAELLLACDLPRLTSELDHVAHWSDQLSPGELQRIAFLRVLLHQPDWVFLDECTAALDLAHEKALYELLKQRLPHCSLVSVGHRMTLADLHDHPIDFAQYQSEQHVIV